MIRRIASRQGRRRTGLYAIEGTRLVERALRAGAKGADAGAGGGRARLGRAEGGVECDGRPSSIQRVARMVHPGPCNGWQMGYYRDPQSGLRKPIDAL